MMGFSGCPYLFEARDQNRWHIVVQQSPNWNQGYVIFTKFGDWDDGAAGETKTLEDAINFANLLANIYKQWTIK